FYDFTRRIDAGISARALFDGGVDQRSTGLGAELGVVVVRDLRVAAGYNVFGFKDRDFTATGSRTDRGGYLALGFKFDESLFGRHASAPAAETRGAADGTAPGPEEGARAQAAAAALPSHAEPPATLAAAGARITDPMIAADLRAIDAWT